MSNVVGPILFHDYEYNVFSNFSAFAIEWGGKIWPTAEQAYQAAKFSDETVQEKIRIARSPVLAYAIAHEHADKMDKVFPEKKLKIMEEILRAKAAQHTHILIKLKESGNRELIKNFGGDLYWGQGPNGEGENHLGKLWMKIRENV